ncbi:MAG: Holliday junction branch migration protein RuvA [Candidatus Paceibacterota bacterium]|jgi:Holliday junction DNA helicase RuvA
MISHLKGILIFHSDKFAILEVAGVGYKIFLSPDNIAKISTKIGEEFSFWTHLAVREDALDLYGFMAHEELEFFVMLLDVSGIGPKSALGILGTASIPTLKKAIATADTSYLTKVSGIGKKTAEKIVLELRDKLSLLGVNDEGGILRGESEVLEALKALGYRENDARDALKNITEDIIGENARIKEALRLLAGK